MNGFAAFHFINLVLKDLINKCEDECLRSRAITALILIDDLVELFFPVIEDIEEKNDLF